MSPASLFRAEAWQAQRERLFGPPLGCGPRNAWFRAPRTPIVLQAEAAECGLACLAMLAGHHGGGLDLATLRTRHPVSIKGATLAELMRIAGDLNLTARPVRCEPEQLHALALPCIVHWDFNHFVVLTRCGARRLVLHDPAGGRREVSRENFSRHFTGIALELTPAPAFERRDERRPLSLRALVGRVDGFAARAVQVLVLALALQAAALAGPYYLRWVVDDALAGGGQRGLLAALALGFGLVAALQAGLAALRGWLLACLGVRLHLQLQSRLLHHMLRLPLAWFQSRQTADVLSRFESLHTVQRTLGTSLLEALVDGLMAVLTLAMMFAYSARLACVGLLAAGLYGLLRLLLYWPMRSAAAEHLIQAARQHGHLLESLRGIQTVKLFAHEPERYARWQSLAIEQHHAALRSERLTLLGQAANGLLFGIENVATVWLGALLVLDATRAHPFSLGMLFAFIAYKAQFVQRSSTLVDKALELRMLGLHAERVADVALTPIEQTAPAAATPHDASGAIELKDVGFRYAAGEAPLLRGLSFRIEAGESVAIVGPSGCGKTTLVKLMLGLLEPTEGRIEIGGVPLRQLGVERFRRAAASVMQDDTLFAGSIADNVSFFDSEPDLARIEQCARQAGLHDDVALLPMRYETAVGDMGSVLSGGQKQRLLLARALYRQPRFLFLDEATSHLDVARERRVNEAVRALRLTRIIVAHRPETIASADRVIDLGERGKPSLSVRSGRLKQCS
jgi:ATP-binding cassette subfamily B protein RaxB